MNTTLTLHITSKERSRDFVLGSEPTRVGRDPRCEISIPDPVISREQFTLSPLGEGVLVQLNPQSRNHLIYNGRALSRCELLPGQSFQVGPYRFELLATVRLPDVPYGGPPPDPAGALDASLIEEGQRAAPRWRVESSSRTVQPVDEPAGSSRGLLAGSTLAILFCSGYLLHGELQPRKAAAVSSATEFRPTDLKSAIRLLDCDTPPFCANQARDLYQTALQLSESGSTDLLTLYKIHKQYYRALHLLGPDPDTIPGLKAHYEEASEELGTTFSDIWFRYRRAVAEGEPGGQLQAMRTLLPLCEEDPHAFCDSMKLSYRRLQDQLATK
jgi:hypothetical protein